MRVLNRSDAIRWIALAAIFAALIGVFAVSFGAATRTAEMADLAVEARRRAILESGALIAEVEKFRVLPFVLVELPDVDDALARGVPTAARRLDGTLLALARQTRATVLYAIDRGGVARAASNATARDSFVGFDFRFRPYFVGAMRDGASEYFAQGTVTGRPGLFLARRAGTLSDPVGVIVVKIEFGRVERLWRSVGRSSMVIDRDGVIVIAGDPNLRLRTIGALSRARRRQLIASRQFGNASLSPAGIAIASNGLATDRQGRRFLAVEQRLPVLGWRHVHLEPLEPAIAAAEARVRLATLIVALVAAALLGTIGWLTTRRRRVAAARARLEQEVAHRTIELTNAYDRLRSESEERQRADSRYRAAREELAQANRLGSIGTITTSVAHEINQPVAAIRTAAENAVKLSARGKADAALENMRLIVSLTARIGAITGELLSYARRGRRAPAITPLDDILNGALMLVGDSFVRAGVTLDVERAAKLPSIRVSRIRIEQVLVNLLQNALDEVTGRESPRVLLAATATPDAVVLTVDDSGAGVAIELSETIFQPFFTGKEHGTGMGLGISREIVADHGGTLEVARSVFGGARFTVTLPRASGDQR